MPAVSYATKLAPRSHTFVMKHKGFYASLMATSRLTGEGVHDLPPGNPIPVYPIDALPGSPESWMRGPGNYVCPVDLHAIWFNWTQNDQMNLAILPSVKGMNPVTGRKLEGLRLEKYAEKCPVHDVPFEGDERFCPKCNYRWPPQSYVSYPNTLWWDGFRQPDGTVRQFFFSEDEARDVASQVIGKQNTVPAFGFAFYEPKVRRAPPRVVPIRASGMSHLSGGICGQSIQGWQVPLKGLAINSAAEDCFVSSTPDDSYDVTRAAPAVYSCSAKPMEHEVKTAGGFEIPEAPKKRRSSAGGQSISDTPRSIKRDVSVGAGAKIAQDLEPDPLKLEEWKEEPSAVVRLYFVFEEQFRKIVKDGGEKDLTGDADGYLKGLPVG